MKQKIFRFCLTALVALVSLASYAYDVCVDGIYYNLSGSTAMVTYKSTMYKSYTGEVVIPSTVTYNGRTYKITSIGEEAFRDCSGLTSVTIPNSVTSIGGWAFWNCSGLTSVTIPNSVTSIGNGAFSGCSGLTSFNVDLDNKYYSSQDNVLFDKAKTTLLCVPIKQGAYTIPNSVTSIGSYAFYECSGLTSVTIPNSVTSIKKRAFFGCSGLTSVTIPNSVTSIEFRAFSYCSGLTSVTIPNSVTTIQSYAFDGCAALTSVTIPNSVTSIESHAFASCRFLETFICNAKRNPALGDDVFEDINLAFATLYVPDASVTGYSKTAPWSEFGNILPLSQVPQGIEEVRIDTIAPSAPIYNILGQHQATPQRGLNIIDGKKRLMK